MDHLDPRILSLFKLLTITFQALLLTVPLISFISKYVAHKFSYISFNFYKNIKASYSIPRTKLYLNR